MNLNLTWTDLKPHIADKSKLRYEDRETFYKIAYPDSLSWLESGILKSDTTDNDDFETNYKPYANTKITNPLTIDTFTAKTVGAKKLYTRATGQIYAATVGSNTFDFLIPYDEMKFNGVEIVNSKSGEYVDLQVLDTPTGTISTVPYYMLNQFGFSVNLPDGYYSRESKYDADLIKDLTVRMIYECIEARDIGVNYLLHELKV